MTARILYPLLVLFYSCTGSKQAFKPPVKNGLNNYDTIYTEANESLSYLSYKGVVFEDLMVQDIFQKSFLQGLDLKYPDQIRESFPAVMFNQDEKNNRVDVYISQPDALLFKGYSPSYYRLFNVMPKCKEGRVAFRIIDVDKKVDSIKKYGLKPAYNFFEKPDPRSDSVQQVFNLALAGNSTYSFQPGSFLIAIPDRLIADGSEKAFHPENRFLVLNSHAFNYKRDVQVFFFHFLYEKLRKGTSGFYFPGGFNRFVDSINATKGSKKENPYLRNFSDEDRQHLLGEFMHVVLSAEYGCTRKPVYLATPGKNKYRFSFYSEVKRTEMIAEFDLRYLRMRIITEAKNIR